MKKVKQQPVQPNRLKKVITSDQSVAIFQLARTFEESDIRRFFNKIKRHLSGADALNAEMLRYGLISLIRVHEELEGVDGMVYELFNREAQGLLTKNQN